MEVFMSFLSKNSRKMILFATLFLFSSFSFSLDRALQEDEEKIDYFCEALEPLFAKWRRRPDIKHYTGLTSSDTAVSYIDNLKKGQLQNLVKKITELCANNYEHPADLGHDIGFILQQRMSNISFKMIQEELQEESVFDELEQIAFRMTRQNETVVDDTGFDAEFINRDQLNIQVGFSKENRQSFPKILSKDELSKKIRKIEKFIDNEGENTVSISIQNIIFRNHLYLIEPLLNLKREYNDFVHIILPPEEAINPSILSEFWEKTDFSN
jgi:hypothetical protein